MCLTLVGIHVYSIIELALLCVNRVESSGILTLFRPIISYEKDKDLGVVVKEAQ